MQQPKYFAFVLMPFAPSFGDVYKIGIKEVVSQFGDMIAERVDEQMYREGILERIYRQIEVADVIIADMSGQNPNVFYEVGYAHAKGKLCILLTSDAGDIPFDLKHQRHIVYNSSIATLRDELYKSLTWARDEIEKQRKSQIKVTPQSIDGNLSLTKFTVTGSLTFKIDLENISKDSAVNIQAIYFYSTEQWTLYQDGKECPRSSADTELVDVGFTRRHFLLAPLQWLQKGAWAQVRFEARGLLASTLRGEQLLDSYHVRAHSIMRLVTANGNFDHQIPIDVELRDIPF
jgi:hypothetical protein